MMKSDFDIDRSENGLVHATNDAMAIHVHTEGSSKVFHRVGIQKNLKMGGTNKIKWLVCEIDGVRLYVNGDTLILTKKDLYP